MFCVCPEIFSPPLDALSLPPEKLAVHELLAERQSFPWANILASPARCEHRKLWPNVGHNSCRDLWPAYGYSSRETARVVKTDPLVSGNVASAGLQLWTPVSIT